LLENDDGLGLAGQYAGRGPDTGWEKHMQYDLFSVESRIKP